MNPHRILVVKEESSVAPDTESVLCKHRAEEESRSSKPGAGTIARTCPPQGAPVPEAERVSGTPAGRPPGGTETVLLVEDEKSLRVTCCRFLETLGYTVLTAASPAAALVLAEQHAGVIHLLLTDVVMPGMSGPELARQLQAVRPALRCLFMSGYTANAIVHGGELEEGVPFLQKPFSRDALACRAREVLAWSSETTT